MTTGSGASGEPWTVLRLLKWTTEHLQKSGSSSPRLDAELLLAEAKGCERIELYTAFAEEPPEEVKARFRELIKRRAAGEPVAYLLGRKEFYSLNFEVSSDVLIPRGETEHLVIECLDRAKALANPVVDPASDSAISGGVVGESASPFQGHALQIADVCTGSGCVAISIAKHFKNCRITAIDLSEKALAIAAKNIEKHAVGDRVTLSQGDLLSGLPDGELDFVVANPPYVSDAEYEELAKTVRDHEPKMALVSGPVGTELVLPLAEQAASKLKPKGWFLCEFSPMIAQSVSNALEQTGQWTNISIIRDLAGQQRLIAAQKR